MMKLKYLPLLFALLLLSCEASETTDQTYADVQIVGAMKNVMWKGDMSSRIDLDTLNQKANLYGLGPETYLTGELLINDGEAYVSRVGQDAAIQMEKTFTASAPFFVYAYVEKWKEVALPETVVTITDLETFVDAQTKDAKRPFAFKLIGEVKTADFHIQNLPKGTKVSSPKEAHQGQVTYTLTDEKVEIVGFFSTEHQGIFTHHDSFLHLHLITNDKQKMGHVDHLELKSKVTKLLLPVR